MNDAIHTADHMHSTIGKQYKASQVKSSSL